MCERLTLPIIIKYIVSVVDYVYVPSRGHHIWLRCRVFGSSDRSYRASEFNSSVLLEIDEDESPFAGTQATGRATLTATTKWRELRHDCYDRKLWVTIKIMWISSSNSPRVHYGTFCELHNGGRALFRKKSIEIWKARTISTKVIISKSEYRDYFMNYNFPKI